MYFASAKEALAGGDYRCVLERIGFAVQVLFKENRALYGLKVGVPKTEDAIRLTGFGVHANDFLELQNFVPEVAEEAGGLKYRWRQGKFGHPGNWKQRAAQFCCEAFLDLAVKIQDAPFIPGPRGNLWVRRSVEQGCGWGTKLGAGEGTASKPVGARGAAPSPAMVDTP